MSLGNVGKPDVALSADTYDAMTDAKSGEWLVGAAYAALAPQSMPTTPPCRVCGSTPTATVTFRMAAGLLRITRTQAEPGAFCRDCGIAIFRQFTARTLSSAWWGPVSAVLAPIVLVRNGLARRKVAALAPPQNPARGRRPMNVGKPVYLRRQIAGLLVPLAVLIALILITLSTPGTDNPTGSVAITSVVGG
jgi:hypothetical protein